MSSSKDAQTLHGSDSSSTALSTFRIFTRWSFLSVLAIACVLAIDRHISDQPLTTIHRLLLISAAMLAVATVIARPGWRAVGLGITASILIGLAFLTVPYASARLFSGEYVGLQRDVSRVARALTGARLTYGREGVDFFRILTDRAFLGAMRITDIADGADAGIELQLTPAQFHMLSAHPHYDFWYGGYYFRVYPPAEPRTSKSFVLVLPPSAPHNFGLIVDQSLYEMAVR